MNINDKPLKTVKYATDVAEKMTSSPALTNIDEPMQDVVIATNNSEDNRCLIVFSFFV
jgi:hypothetical protein